MSEFGDPRDPIRRDPRHGTMDDINRRQSDAYGSGTIWIWLIGVVVLIAVLFFAFGSGRDSPTARLDAPPASTPTTPSQTQ